MISRHLKTAAALCSWAALLTPPCCRSQDFYDTSVLRNVQLNFAQSNWWQLLTANAQSEQNLPAQMIVDGVSYDSVGVRFRGFTSYAMTGDSKKKSFNVKVDWKLKQDVGGYETLNLINCFEDPTFIREALYSNTVRYVLPSAKVGFVRLTINGESWGVYSNVQQLDGQFIREWFPNNKGTRWRAGSGKAAGGGAPGGGGPGGFPGGGIPGGGIPGGGTPGGGGADAGMDFGASLAYSGSDTASYAELYKIVHTEQDHPWQSLIHACDVLNNTPWNLFTTEVPKVLDVDRTLWLCAFEIAFHDDDGYVYKRGGDYFLYSEPESGRIHLIQFDGNSCMKTQRDGQWPALFREEDAKVPIMHLLVGGVAEYRERYLAHIRTIVKNYLTEEFLFPKLEAYRSLIETEVKSDTKKLYSNSAFDSGILDLKTFIRNRRAYLLGEAEVARPAPEITSIDDDMKNEGSGWRVSIEARIGDAIPVAGVNLFLSDGDYGPFSVQQMFDDGQHCDGAALDGTYGIQLSAYPPATVLRYYVQAVAADAYGTVTFQPEAEHLASRIMIPYPHAGAVTVAINELMAQNRTSIADPQGEFDDWIELTNTTSEIVNLSGMYLSDNPLNPLKWQFPDGALLDPGGFLIVWADEDGQAAQGLHANFKLSAAGETVMLFDSDANGNALMDSVTYGLPAQDQSYGRFPDAASEWQTFMNPTPGRSNDGYAAVDGVVTGSMTCRLRPAYPNPFNPVATISFSIPNRRKVILTIFNSAGREVAKLNEGVLEAGIHERSWRADGMPSGIYFCRIVAGTFVQTQKIALIR